MPSKKEKFYITTPIYYVNDRPHLGHAYTTIAADILARYWRLQGRKVFFLTGTDEHGDKIEKAARKAGKNPQQLCDENSEKFKNAWQSLNISYDNFIRTTAPKHIKAVQKVLAALYDKGFIYKGIYKGLYCSGCEQYKTESDLADGKCPDHQLKPFLMEEESYLFGLSKFGKILEKKTKKDELEIKPRERKNEVSAFLKQGLADISISRQKVKWGIPLPFDSSQTCYVWIDAFLSYLTGIGWNGDPKKLPQFWPADLHLMAKDILRVHATIWPALLLALGIPLPKKLFAHGYFTLNGQKMSKSLGNIIWPEEMLEKFGVDATRYLLLAICSFGKDGDISWEKLTERYNADLAGGLGNLVARVITLATKLKTQNSKLKTTTQNLKLKKEIEKTWKSYHKALEELKFSEALTSIWNLISFCDRYIEKERPWEAKNQKVISGLLFVLTEIAKLLEPFLPETSEKIFEQIKTKKSKPLFPRLS